MGAGANVLVSRVRVEDFESLRESLPSSTSEVVQLEKGRMSGVLTHITAGDLSLSSGFFSHGVRVQGVFSDRRFTLGILMDASDKVSTTGHEMRPGDLALSPPGSERYSRYYGAAAFAMISVSPAEFFSFLGSEPPLGDLMELRNRTLLRGYPEFKIRDQAVEHDRFLDQRTWTRTVAGDCDILEKIACRTFYRSHCSCRPLQ